MKIFLDTEFTALRQDARLISIGLAAENGDKFYAELTDYAHQPINDWVIGTVIPLLTGDLPEAKNLHPSKETFCKGTSAEVSVLLRQWFIRFGEKNNVEIWADVLAWDWVLFCELFGGAFGIPEQVYYIPFDLSTALKMKGLDPNTTREELGQVTWSLPSLHLKKHHALYDALLEKSIFENLNHP